MIKRRDNVFLVTLIVLALLKAGLTRSLIFGGDNPVVAIALEFAAVVGFLCLVDALPLKRRPLITLTAYIGVVVVMYANVLYASYFDQIADPGTFMVADQVGSVLDIVVGLIRPIHLLYVVDLTALIVWAVNMSDPTLEPSFRSGSVTAFAVLALSAFAVQVVVINGFPASVDGVALAQARGLGAYQVASFLGEGSSADASVLGLASLPASGTADADQQIPRGAAVQKRIESLRKGRYGTRVGGVQHAAYPDANIYVIQVESFQAFAQGATLGDEEVTPYMNDFAEESWLFPNAFAQTGAGNTSDAEFVANTSLLPPSRTPAVVAYVDREIPSLPRALGESGYRTITMHANEASFWNRTELYASLGFDDYYDAKQFGKEDLIYRGTSDAMFFVKAQQYLEAELARAEPLYVNLVTMSSHAPFDGIPQDRRPLQVPEKLRNTRAGRFLGAISYTDVAVGRFIQWLKDTGEWDDSIVVLYGDHTAIKDLDLKGDNKEIIEGMLGRPYSEVDRQRIAMMVHLPGQTEGGVIDSVVGQCDIAPTIADLVGEDISAVPHLGRSMFVDSDPFVIMRAYFPSGSFINAGVAFMPKLSFADGRALEITTGSEMTPGYQEEDDFDRAGQLSEISDEWIRSCPPRANVGDIKDAFIPTVKTESE